QVVPYARKYRHIGVSGDFKAWLLWCEDTGRVFTAALVRFDEAPVIHAAYSMEPMDDSEAVVDAIECIEIGDFRLGNALDGQDAAVKVMESRDPYGSDSPSYEEAVRSGDADDWRAAMKEENQVHVEDDPPKDKKKLLRSRRLLGTKRTMQGALCRRKARIIVGGHKQLKGVNYTDTFTPTPMW
ncbi:uncharacterized protein VP01_11797g1, partial [Puccinia sorghi]